MLLAAARHAAMSAAPLALMPADEAAPSMILDAVQPQDEGAIDDRLAEAQVRAEAAAIQAQAAAADLARLQAQKDANSDADLINGGVTNDYNNTEVSCGGGPCEGADENRAFARDFPLRTSSGTYDASTLNASALACPSTSADNGAGMQITAIVDTVCQEVLDELRARVDGQYSLWHDPHNNGTFHRRWQDPYTPTTTYATSYQKWQLELGLRWIEIGPDEPRSGVELHNPTLAEALKSKTVFTHEEWKAMQVDANAWRPIDDIFRDQWQVQEQNFIKVGDSYFRPDNFRCVSDANCVANHSHQVRRGLHRTRILSRLRRLDSWPLHSCLLFAPQLFTLWNVGESGHPRWRTADPEDDTTEEFTRCKIEACSRSLDDSDADDDGATNYCTLKMMFCGPADGCKPVMHSFNLVGSEATEPSAGAIADMSKCLVY